ncbi:hypothetical protein UFOVP787_59 [uncultured Caudovirales phage]|uniref:Uncharacterized protein n=1 Tax=uncultured Caudovirales phage TaxID=2100421 RepID=A0A6J5NUS4_9CAUD|nr:hypothetical protein UFOVP787_59 [uncultured Caudovirales phage]
MKNKVIVHYVVKHTDKSSVLFGLLIDRKERFETFTDAVKFARGLNGFSKNGVTVYGKPVIEDQTELKEAV